MGAGAQVVAKRDPVETITDPTTPISDKMDALIELGWTTPEDKADILEQEKFAAAHSEEFDRVLAQGKVIAISAEEVFVTDSSQEARRAAEQAHPGRQILVLVKGESILRW